MAHTRKDSYAAPTEWWKHLRPFNKRLQAQAERRAAKKYIKDELVDIAEKSEMKRGLTNE